MSPLPPWSAPSGVEVVLDRWLASRYVQPCFAADEARGGRDGTYADLPPSLAPGVARALRDRGVDRLYSHQARAFALAEAREKRGFVVATPTASGKSLCFHLPVLQALTKDEGARALYLFPTKALARDQEAGLRELAAQAGVRAGAVVYDGDTPGDARRAAREQSGVVLTNPDMLHAGILPHHTSWARTLRRLEYVVVDEMHVYKGVFGSHVANVLRRLLRVAAFHGARPFLIGATATIGNPREHAARLFGVEREDLALLDESGAPHGERRFFLFNPPVVNAELGMRASYVKQAVMLASDLVKARVPTIVFGQSRNNVEVMLRYLRDKVATDGVDPKSIQGYRGGYLPAQRRAIEEQLRSGEIAAVVATNALELGIDIGDLDAVICAGYPGSVAGTWQRFGRAGRRGAKSIGVMVACSAPLDQYLTREPKFLFGSPVEEARIDPSNVEILLQHLKCAAFELPFKRGEAFGSLEADETSQALGFLAGHGVLHEAASTFHWAADAYPANDVSLRSAGWDNVVVVDVTPENTKIDPRRGDAAKGHTIAEMDWRGAHTMLHEQAIYQHDGETYQVERFDYENKKAFVRKVDPDYFTEAMAYTQVSVLEESGAGSLLDAPTRGARGAWSAGWGEVALVEKVVGFKKIKFFTHENAGYGEVRLPEMQMHTAGFWLTVPEHICDALEHGRAAAIDALRGVGRALETVATLALMCDPRDIGTTLGDQAPKELSESGAPRSPDESGEHTIASAPIGGAPFMPQKIRGGPRPGFAPTLFLYEHTPGGLGLAERIFEQREILVRRAHQLVVTCPCKTGCPACVGPGEETSTWSRKTAALELLVRELGKSAG